MRIRTLVLPVVVLGLVTTAAEAASHREAPIVDYDIKPENSDVYVFDMDFFDRQNQVVGTGRAQMGGRISVRTRPDLGPRRLVLDDIAAFDIEIRVADASLPVGFPTDFAFKFDLLNAGVDLDLINGFFSNREVLPIDLTGLPQTPIFQLLADLNSGDNSFDSFPFGQSSGDDASVILALFSGSVNVGLALLPDGFAGPPGLVGIGQLSPDDRIDFAREALALAPVPLPPAGGLLLLAAAPFAYAWRRRRRAA